jgi:hypothetical protein
MEGRGYKRIGRRGSRMTEAGPRRCSGLVWVGCIRNLANNPTAHWVQCLAELLVQNLLEPDR